MPKRTLENDDKFDYFKKKLKKLEKELNTSRKRRIRVIESSSSSSSSSSRDPSPSRLDPQDGDIRSVPSTEDLPEHQDAIASLLDENASAAPDHTSDLAMDSAMDTSPAHDALDTIVMDILGDDPSATIEYGPDVHKDLATRFEHIATHGLEQAQRKELLEKYKIPTNCTLIAAPILNAEIKAALPEPMVKRDISFETRQKQLATAISCLASAVTDQLLSSQINQDLLRKLMDTGRLLCDIQSTDSKARRNFAMFSVKKDMKEHLSNTKIDKHLFGENLSDTLRSAKAVNKSGTDLKVQPKVFKKTALPHSSKPPAKNWKPQVPARRLPGPQPRSREPAYHRSQPATSSRQSSPPPRTSRRR